jgi:hypothetical protein
MLFPYVTTRHRMGLMQAFVSYIFAKVWCKAPNCEYSIELFSGFPALFEIMEQLDRENKAGQEKGAGAFFYLHVNAIFIEFKSLKRKERRQFHSEFRSNNDIRALCEGRRVAARYPKNACAPLMEKIKDFFSKLYSSGFFDLKIVRNAIGGDLRDHYRGFAKANAIPCCPFCGLQPMDTEHDPTREAYDHYLPSSIYPFNSVNLKNLAPACHKCNSQNKQAGDPLLSDGGNARRAFYPYAATHPAIAVSLRFLGIGEIPKLPGDLEVTLHAVGYEDQLDTWDSLYKIKQRYAAKSCGAVGGRHWMNRILIECANYGRTPDEMLDAELLTCDSSPWVDASFLKAAFLREAVRVGLVQAVA